MRELIIDEIVSVSGGADSPKEEVNVWAQRSQDGGGGGPWNLSFASGGGGESYATPGDFVSETVFPLAEELASQLCRGPAPQQIACQLAVQEAVKTAPAVSAWANEQFADFVGVLDQAFSDIRNGALSGPMPLK
jgi:hypothetical protein